MDSEAKRQAQRGAFLTVMMTLLGGGVFLFFLFLTCGGLAVAILAVLAGVVAYGALSYFLWGHALAVTAAREAAPPEEPQRDGDLDRAEAKDWSPEERAWYRRF
jgi:hypothetical protein